MEAGNRSSTLIVTGLVGTTSADLRMRLRSALLLVLNPLALVLLGSIAAGYVFVLVVEGSNLRSSSIPSGWLELASFSYGILLLVVALTAQRGSPLRLKLADVSWALQSAEGPRVSVVFYGMSGALLALAGSSAASAIALALRGENPLWGFVSGGSVAVVILLLRSTSLLSHLVGLIAPPLVRQALLLAIIAAAAIWTALFLSRRIDVEGLAPFRAPLDVVLRLFEGIFTPELGFAVSSAGIAALSLAALALVIVHAQRFVEPAVHEAILSNQISNALAGNKSLQGIQSRGYRSGIPSWRRWPDRPIAALLVGHLAQTRRRLRSYVASVVVYLLLVGLFVLLREQFPLIVGALLLSLLLSISSPSQPLASDIDHQHLLLSGVSIVRAGFSAIALDGVLSFAVALPAALLWGSFYFSSISGILLIIPVLLLYCVMCSFAGLAAHIFSESPVGRALAAVVLSAIPLLSAVSALAVYGEASDSARIVVAMAGTLVTAGCLYAGFGYAVLYGAERRA